MVQHLRKAAFVQTEHWRKTCSRPSVWCWGCREGATCCHTHHRLAWSEHTKGHTMTEHIEQAHWEAFFNNFDKKHHGFETRIEIMGRAFGDQEVATSLPFSGISYDPHHHQI